jgi:hypothetical protein
MNDQIHPIQCPVQTISITNVVEPLASVTIANVTSADRGTTRAQVGDTLRFSYTRAEGTAPVHWTWYTGIDPATIGNWFGPSRIYVGGDVSEFVHPTVCEALRARLLP